MTWPSIPIGGTRLWGTSTYWNILSPSTGVAPNCTGTDGTYVWTNLDQQIQTADANGTNLIYTVIGFDPCWIATNQSQVCGQVGMATCSPPNDVAADGTGTDNHLITFITAFMNHLECGGGQGCADPHHRIIGFECANESNGPVSNPTGPTGYWAGTIPQLARMCKDIYTTVKGFDKTMVITSPSTSKGIDNLDTQWNEVGGDQRIVNYTSLLPGRYVFHVQAAAGQSDWSASGAILNIQVLPPWWSTWWFRSTIATLSAALLWGLYQLRLQQLRRQFNVRVEARVNERTRIARELHDTLLQSLHGLMFEFQAASNMFRKRPQDALQALDGAIAGTEQAITESQDAIEDLRSPATAENDLAQLIKLTGENLATSRGVGHDCTTFGLTVEGQQRALTPVIRDEIHRIAREVLRNAFRHAQARRIEAEILYDEGQLRLRVRDDGKGMDPQVLEKGGRPGHWGLPGVRERAQQIGAKLDVWSEAGAGTEVQLAVAASVAYQKTGRSRFGLIPKDWKS